MKVIVLLICTLLATSSLTLLQKDLDSIKNHINTNGNLAQLSALIPIGSMAGFFNLQDLWQLHSFLEKNYSNIVGKLTSFGKTYQKRDMMFFKVGHDINNTERPKKSAILFNSMTHSREPSSQSILITTMIDMVKTIQHEKTTSTGLFQDQLDAFFIPVVNIDAVTYIGSRWGKSDWSQAKMHRKNMNLTHGCGKYKGGVDLNRNYGFMFNAYHNDQGSSHRPCSSQYRGPHAWSEPETRAIKSFIESHPEIKSAQNFHAYGDLIISPYNFERFPKQHLLQTFPRWNNFYQGFKKSTPKRHNTKFGKAYHSIKYSANGESSDWMLRRHNIIAFSPEVGTDGEFAQHFYVKNTKTNIPKIMAEFFPTIKHFINKHNTDLKVVNSKVNGTVFTLKLFNQGLTDLFNTKLFIKINSSTNQMKSASIQFQDENQSEKLTKKSNMSVNDGGNTATVSLNLSRLMGVILNITFNKDLQGKIPNWEFSVENGQNKKLTNATNKKAIVAGKKQ